MKYLLFIIIGAAAAYHYLKPSDTVPAEAAKPVEASVNPTDPNAIDPSTLQAVEKPAEEEEDPGEPAVRMVQIHGKWYKYRQDNTYVIDGVPTLFIPQAPPEKETIKTQVIAVAKAKDGLVVEDEEEAKPAPKSKTAAPADKRDEARAKSQKLMDMAGKNPLKVYTPDGFKTLKDGVDAAKSAHQDRAKAIEDATKGN